MKKMIIIVLTLVFAISLVGCNLLDNTEPDNPKNKSGFRIAIMDNAMERSTIEKIIEGFKKQNPDIKDEIKIVSYAGDYAGKIQNQASAGVLPDVFLTMDTLVGFFAQNHISLNISEYIKTKTEKEQAEYNAIFNDIYPSLLGLGRVDDNLHMIAREYARMVVYYNKTLIPTDKYPKNGWTWNEFKTLATSLVKKNGSVIVQNGVDARLNWAPPQLSMIYGFGGEIINKEGTAGALSEKSMLAFKEIKEMVASGAMANNFAGLGTSWGSGTVAMYIDGRSGLTSTNSKLGDGNWDVVSFPEMPTGSIGMGTSGYSISNKSNYKDLAVKFVMYIASEDGQNVFGKTGNNLPIRMSMKDSGIWREYNPNINNDAFIYKPEYDIPPINALLKNQAKAGKVIDAINYSLENYILAESPNTLELMATYNQKLTDALK